MPGSLCNAERSLCLLERMLPMAQPCVCLGEFKNLRGKSSWMPWTITDNYYLHGLLTVCVYKECESNLYWSSYKCYEYPSSCMNTLYGVVNGKTGKQLFVEDWSAVLSDHTVEPYEWLLLYFLSMGHIHYVNLVAYPCCSVFGRLFFLLCLLPLIGWVCVIEKSLFKNQKTYHHS